jgi:hypothetical protein
VSQATDAAGRANVWTRAGLSGLIVGFLVAGAVGFGGAVAPADPAQAADESETSSAVTLTNSANALNPEGAPFPDLEVTVSQTENLVSQGLRVSWKNGKQSAQPQGSAGGANFLQVAQCWGEDPLNPGHPDRRTCQYGGTRGYAATRDGFTQMEQVAPQDQQYTGDLGWYAYTGIPFVATNAEGIVDEKKAPADRVLDNFTTNDAGQIVKKPDAAMADLNTNQFFTQFTTNEIKWAPAGADGTGSVPFEVQTAMQSTALGCGSPITQADNTVVGQSCWLVIIPRGEADSGNADISGSGLWWDAWEHHLAVKLDFKPLGVRCQIGAAERQLAGSELIAGAMSSWQPQLCLGENGSPFVLNQSSEADALMRAAGTAPSPLAFTSRPLDMAVVPDATDPLAYAPVAISGIAISFSIDRSPHPSGASDEYKSRAGLPMTDLKLTPRLIAKLLTASYTDSLPARADLTHIGYTSFQEPGPNARTLLQDKDFLENNDPEWAAQIIASISVADALVPSGRSDLALRLWEYVLADAEAKTWLDGEPDPWGMKVNPWYSTNAEVNPTGVGLQLPAESFPKADPVEKPDTTPTGSHPDPQFPSGPINLVTWRPFTSSFADGAYNVLRGDGKLLGGWNTAPPAKFDKNPPAFLGSQRVIGISSTPSAQLYQTVTASLRNSAGEFVAPTQESLSAGAAAMSPTTQPSVLAYNPASAEAKAAPSAYPLTMPVYAALNPKQTDTTLRAVYANLIRYAAGNGQNPGTDIGQLPPGYAPLPQSWVDQALAAANAIEAGALPSTAPTGGSKPSAGGSSSPIPTRTAARTQMSAAAAPAAAATSADPAAAGAPAGELVGAATPDDPELGVSAAAVPAGLAAGLATALLVPLMSRIRRRA